MNRRERRKQRVARQRSAETAHPSDLPVPAVQPVPKPAAEVAPETPSGSTGPTSEEGKATSSRNAVKHNLCSKKLTGADLEEYNELLAKFDSEWEPTTETERLLLAQMALSQWRLNRALSLELDVFDQQSGFGRSTGVRCRCAKPESTLDPAALALVLRYSTTAERNFYKALAELQRLRTAIRNDARRAEEDEEKEVQREIERLIMAPIRPSQGAGPQPQFVSQNSVEGARPQFVSQNPPSSTPNHSIKPHPDAA